MKGRGKVVLGQVAQVTETDVALADGALLPYDFLVLAPGCGGGSFGKAAQTTLEERQAYYSATAARLAAADSIIVVGGGPTGVELAAEIATELAGKPVKLVAATAALCPMLSASASTSLRSELEAMGVQVLTGTRLAQAASGGFSTKTEGGEELGATGTVVLDCTGSAPNTAWARAAGGHKDITLNDGGFIVVTPQLTVGAASNVFALGDAAQTGEAKQGYLCTTNQVPTVVANLLAALSTPPGAPKVAPKGPDGIMLVTLGKSNGLIQFPGGYVAAGYWLSWLPTLMKSKGLFIDKVRGEFGV